MRWSTRVALLSSAVTGVAAPGLAALYVAANDGFGAADLPAFGFWSAFLAVFIGTLAGPVLRHAGRRRRAVALILAALTGVAAGGVFTVAVALGLGPVVGAFSFPIFYLWATAGALGLLTVAVVAPASTEELGAPPRTLRRVLAPLALVLAVVIIMPVVMFLGSALIWGRAEHAIHLIPAGYEGPVLIIYGEPGGARERREGKARVYEIPADGVLRTQFGPNPGWAAPDYFHVDARGQRTPVIRGAPCTDSLPGDPVQACSMPVVVMATVTASGSAAARAPAPAPPVYESYVVSRRADRRVHEARWNTMVRETIFADSSLQVP